uniref:Seipin n=1 Tax=Corethrella appendiculata TaxID=1370023 RepID=U5EVA8_9DIPT
MNFITLLLNIFDPLKIVRNYILKPAITIIVAMLESYRNKTRQSVQTTKNAMLRVTLFTFLIFILIWASIFMYAYFYYSYMPAVSHVKDVHMNYRRCEYHNCEIYPEAEVILTKNQQLLMVGQPYKVYLHIDMPESPKNHDLGMFTVCARMTDQSNKHGIDSCRLAMLHYKSPLLKQITTWMLSPLFVFGYREEIQHISVELFTNFEDDQNYPITKVKVQIKSKDVQFYSVRLQIAAHFTGLRYFMFNWPVLSAVVGISTNLFFILIICMLSWYHWDDNEWLDEVRERYKRITQRSEELLATAVAPVVGNLVKSDLNAISPLLDENSQTSESVTKEKDIESITDDDNISIIEELGSTKSDDDDYFLDDHGGKITTN